MKTSNGPLVAGNGAEMDTGIGTVLDTALGKGAEKLEKVVSVPGLKEALANTAGKKKTQAAKPPKENKMKTPKTSRKQAKPATVTPPTAPAPASAPVPAPEVASVPVLVPAPAPAPKLEIQAEPENDLLAGILAEDGGQTVMKAISMASAVLDNRAAVIKFVDTIQAADALAAMKQKFGGTGIKDWFKLSLEQVEQQLRTWANGGEVAAKTILATLGAFKKGQVAIVAPLWMVVQEIVRPTAAVKSYSDLMELLEKLYHDGWISKFVNRGKLPENAIMLPGKASFVAPSKRHMAEVAWTYIMAAKAEAEKTQRMEEEDLEGLMAQASVEFFPTADPADQAEGKLAFKTSPSMGAVLEIVQTVSGPRVRIVESIGFGGTLSNHLIRFTDGMDMWPKGTGGLYYAFQEWRRRVPQQ